MGDPSPVREFDVALAQRAAAGEREAQRELFDAQKLGVHRTLYRLLGANRELEDLIQDAFLEIFRSVKNFRGDSTLARWCQTIATRIAYLHISRRTPPMIDLAIVEGIVAGALDTERHVYAREATRRLYSTLEHIEVKQRIAFALCVIDGRTLAEVAELTESSLFATKTRVWRARKTLFARAAKDPVLASYLAELTEGSGQ